MNNTQYSSVYTSQSAPDLLPGWVKTAAASFDPHYLWSRPLESDSAALPEAYREGMELLTNKTWRFGNTIPSHLLEPRRGGSGEFAFLVRQHKKEGHREVVLARKEFLNALEREGALG